MKTRIEEYREVSNGITRISFTPQYKFLFMWFCFKIHYPLDYAPFNKEIVSFGTLEEAKSYLDNKEYEPILHKGYRIIKGKRCWLCLDLMYRDRLDKYRYHTGSLDSLKELIDNKLLNSKIKIIHKH